MFGIPWSSECSLSNLINIDLILWNRKIWQPYFIDPLNIERYKLISRWRCESHHIPDSDVIISTKVEPLCKRYWRWFLSDRLKSKIISRNCTLLTLVTGQSKIFSGRVRRILFCVNVIHWDLSGERSRPWLLRYTEIWSREFWTELWARCMLSTVE